jgi:hypothetical protein
VKTALAVPLLPSTTVVSEMAIEGGGFQSPLLVAMIVVLE